MSMAMSATLGGRSPHTQRAYEHDVREFVGWAERWLPRADRRQPSIAAPVPRVPRPRGFRPGAGSLPQGPRRCVPLPSAIVPARGSCPRTRPCAACPASGDARLPRVLPGRRRRSSTTRMSRSISRVHSTTRSALARRDVAVLEVLYGATYRRVSECCGLTIEDCDLRAGLVTVVGKGGRVRRVRWVSRRSPQ